MCPQIGSLFRDMYICICICLCTYIYIYVYISIYIYMVFRAIQVYVGFWIHVPDTWVLGVLVLGLVVQVLGNHYLNPKP